jgi:uncharacterized membrane protein YoaK (UPF0700 family)
MLGAIISFIIWMNVIAFAIVLVCSPIVIFCYLCTKIDEWRLKARSSPAGTAQAAPGAPAARPVP